MDDAALSPARSRRTAQMQPNPMETTSRTIPAIRRTLGGLLALALLNAITIAAGPIASSSFVGAENPLSENGTWVAVTAYSPYGTVFRKNNGAYPDRLSPLNHAGARTTASVPNDHYSEIVVGHVANQQQQRRRDRSRSDFRSGG